MVDTDNLDKPVESIKMKLANSRRRQKMVDIVFWTSMILLILSGIFKFIIFK